MELERRSCQLQFSLHACPKSKLKTLFYFFLVLDCGCDLRVLHRGLNRVLLFEDSPRHASAFDSQHHSHDSQQLVGVDSGQIPDQSPRRLYVRGVHVQRVVHDRNPHEVHFMPQPVALPEVKVRNAKKSNPLQ